MYHRNDAIAIPEYLQTNFGAITFMKPMFNLDIEGLINLRILYIIPSLVIFLLIVWERPQEVCRKTKINLLCIDETKLQLF